MRLRLYLDPAVIEIGEPLSGSAYPYLTTVGALRLQARAGYISALGVNESPSLALVLDNCGNRVADIIGQPLRRRADVLNDDGSPYWQGVVSAVTYGRMIGLTVAA